MQQKSDPFSKLRPRPATPAEDCCSCTELRSVYLAYVLTENPIQCLSCRGEVAPERIGFDSETAELIVSWNTIYGSIYALWLDSGEYESWAETELLRKDSPINVRGLTARRKLSQYIPTKYLWFWNGSRPVQCPVCSSQLSSVDGERVACSSCEVLA
jgi:hypothetical protein